MAGLPHYKSSRASVNNWEPLYKAHFEIILTPPPAVGGWELVMEQVLKIDGLATDKMPETVDQKYKSAKRRFAGGIVDDTGITLTLDFEVNLNDNNSAYTYKALRQWCNIIYDPLTGRMGLKRDYVGGPMVVSAFNKAGDIYRQWKFPTVFPITPISAMDFEYGSNEIYQIQGFQFAADYWEETVL